MGPTVRCDIWSVKGLPPKGFGLSISLTEVILGTCQLQFQASGEAADELRTIDFAPNHLRSMAGWVIDQCVRGESSGGYVTHQIANTLDYVTDGMTFYEDPFRKTMNSILRYSRNIRVNNIVIAPDTTFLSLLVWNSDNLDMRYNPGDMDPFTGQVILQAIAAVWHREPESPVKVNIERNYEYFYDAVRSMDRSKHRTWWDSPLGNSTSPNAKLTEMNGNVILPAPAGPNLTHTCGKATQATTNKCVGLAGGGVTSS